MTSSPMCDRYGPIALVTGASDGIGRDMTPELAAAGLDLVGTAGIEAALSALDDVEAGLLGAAAGYGQMGGPPAEADLAGERGMTDVNRKAVRALAHQTTRRRVPRGRGEVVPFSSIAAFQGAAGSANTPP